MKKARFAQKQPLLKTFDSGNNVYVFICANEKEVTEETQQAGPEEAQTYSETVYEYDYNEFVASADQMEDIRNNPENYLTYEPDKSVEQQLKEQKEQLETQKLLIQYVAEMGDIYIPE